MITHWVFAAVVFIWGSTWIMVKFQVGVVPPAISVAYRMGLSALIMLVCSALGPTKQRFSTGDHLRLMCQGALIFSTNFFLFYLAAQYLTTGLIAVVFSTASVMTMGIKTLFTGYRPSRDVVLGSVLGVCGICLVFRPELTGIATGAGPGLLLSIGGTLSFSVGSLVSGKNQSRGLGGPGSTGRAMAYGTGLLLIYATIMGNNLTIDLRLPYVASLLYLSLIGSVAAFVLYFELIRRIHPERAAYATVLFPVVALFFSTLFENYHWSAMALAGVIFTLAGNILVLRR